MLSTNVGSIDRVIRLLLALASLYLGLVTYSGTGLGIAFIVAGSVLLTTALVGFCGLYRLLGIHTNQAPE